MPNQAALAKMEMTVIRALIRAGLAQGYVVSVWDGGEWVLKRSNKITKIVSVLRTTDEDKIVFRNHRGEFLGSAKLVYGNMPYEVIADHSDNEVMDTLMKEVEPVAERIEAKC